MDKPVAAIERMLAMISGPGSWSAECPICKWMNAYYRAAKGTP